MRRRRSAPRSAPARERSGRASLTKAGRARARRGAACATGCRAGRRTPRGRRPPPSRTATSARGGPGPPDAVCDEPRADQGRDLDHREERVRVVELELEPPGQVCGEGDPHRLPGRDGLLDVVAVEVHLLARVRSDDDDDLVALLDGRTFDPALRPALLDDDRDRRRRRRGCVGGRGRGRGLGGRDRRNRRAGLGVGRGGGRLGRPSTATAREREHGRGDGEQHECRSHRSPWSAVRGAPRAAGLPRTRGGQEAPDRLAAGDRGAARRIGPARAAGATPRTERGEHAAARRTDADPTTNRTRTAQAAATGSWSASPTMNVDEVSSQGTCPVCTNRSRCSWTANPSGAMGTNHHVDRGRTLRSCSARPAIAIEARSPTTWGTCAR